MTKLIELTTKEFAESLTTLINTTSDKYKAKMWQGYNKNHRVYMRDSNKLELGYVEFKDNGNTVIALSAIIDNTLDSFIEDKMAYLFNVYSLRVGSIR